MLSRFGLLQYDLRTCGCANHSVSKYVPDIFHIYEPCPQCPGTLMQLTHAITWEAFPLMICGLCLVWCGQHNPGKSYIHVNNFLELCRKLKDMWYIQKASFWFIFSPQSELMKRGYPINLLDLGYVLCKIKPTEWFYQCELYLRLCMATKLLKAPHVD